MGSPPANSQKYLGIQCLRALAAFGVVISHLLLFEHKYEPGSVFAPAAVDYGMAGVDLFFVISGFIIASVTMGRFGRPGESARFLRQRFVRIYPIYWVYSLAVLAVFLVDPAIVNSSHGRPDVLRSFLLLPQRNLPLLLVAWTLVYEVFFYLVFSLAIRILREPHLPLALLGWALWIVVGNRLLPTAANPFMQLVFSPLILEFIAGCLIAVLLTNPGRGTGWACLTVGVAGFVGGSAALGVIHEPFPLGWGRVLIYGTAATFLVTGVLALERGGWRRFPRLGVALGDASYSLYLSHILVLAVIGRLWARLLAGPSLANHVLALSVAVAAALLWGWLSFRLIETPMLTALRRRIVPRRPAAAIPAAVPAVRLSLRSE